MSLVLHSGAISEPSTRPAHLRDVQRRGLWPAHVPSVVLTEALTGDHRRDHHTNRLLGACHVREVDETLAREAATPAHRYRACRHDLGGGMPITVVGV